MCSMMTIVVSIILGITQLEKRKDLTPYPMFPFFGVESAGLRRRGGHRMWHIITHHHFFFCCAVVRDALGIFTGMNDDG